MPMHDWTRVPAGIFHAFHHRWISAISDALNAGLLPGPFYALPEQMLGKTVPDVLTLKGRSADGQGNPDPAAPQGGVATAVRSRPSTRFRADAETDGYRKRKSSIAVRHVSDDSLVAIVEIVSPGDKDAQSRFQEFVTKVCQFLDEQIHLLILDPFPPGPRDPNGVHDAIWRAHCDQGFTPPADNPLTLVAYERELAATHAYIEPIAVGDPLPEMPVFLQPEACVMVPLEATYNQAFAVQPERWRRVVQS